MKIKRMIAVALSCMMVLPMGMTAMGATTVSTVRLSITPDYDDYMSPGDVTSGMEPVALDGGYYVDEWDVSNSSPEPRKSYTYTMDILPESGYAFSSNTTVSVYGAVDVSIRSRSSSKISVRVKTYPYHVLAEPSNIQIDESAKKVTWDAVPYAKKYSVIVHYTNKNGDERQTTKSTTKTEQDLSGYIGKYEDVDVSVRALKGTTDADKFISSSDYIMSSGSVDEDNSEDEYQFAIPTAHSDGTVTNSSSTGMTSTQPVNPSTANGPGSTTGSTSTSNGPVGPGSSEASGWHGAGENWYYVNNGRKVTGWLNLNGEWYLFNSNGEMLYGWQYVDNNWYWLNMNHDGTFGKMLAGYQTINGATYYLNENHDGTYGAMYANRTTPNGRYAAADGAIR